MTDDEALEALFAMANVQDGYAKKATDPGLKLIYKANAKAQREVAATIKDLRARLAAAEWRVSALTEALIDHNDMLRSAMQICERAIMHEEFRVLTNWDTFHDRVSVTLKKHHQITNAAREAGHEDGANG